MALDFVAMYIVMFALGPVGMRLEMLLPMVKTESFIRKKAAAAVS